MKMELHQNSHKKETYFSAKYKHTVWKSQDNTHSQNSVVILIILYKQRITATPIFSHLMLNNFPDLLIYVRGYKEFQYITRYC